ncbi:MAG: metal-dependent hydrolase [Pseudomonadota bacterium]|nr:metal-dependent hydrolase [Pseudomonadota bacterium]
MNAKVKSSTGLTASFPVRRMDFEFADVPHYWLGSDAGMTHFMTSMSVLFPDGERFFVDSVRAMRNHPLIKDDLALQKEISAFIGQEAMHSKEHASFNASAKAYGHDTDRLEQITGRIIGLKRFLGRRNQAIVDMAATCALEHFTATIASQLLRREDIQTFFQDPVMYRLWMWHAVEENEHKAVAFDVYQRIYGSGVKAYVTRAVLMIAATVALFITQNIFMALLMREDGKLAPKHWGRALKTLYHPTQGFITQVLPDLADYFRPSFHPNDHDTVALLAAWKKKLAFSG